MKWKRCVIKNRLSNPAIETICRIINFALYKWSFNKLKMRNENTRILSRIAKIYSHNLKFNILEVLLVNMLKERRAEKY